MTPTEIFLAIIACQLGFICLFLIAFLGMEVMNGMYVRKCHAEAQKLQAEAAANNPLAGLDLRNIQLPGMVHASGQPAPGASPAAPTPCTKDEDGKCKDCTGECKEVKAEEGGNYL